MAYYKFLFLFLDVLCAKLVVAICEFFWAKLLVLVVVVCSSKNYNSLSEKGPTSTSHKSNLSINKIELPNCLVRHGPNPGPNQNCQENQTSKPSKLRFCNQNGNKGGPWLPKALQSPKYTRGLPDAEFFGLSQIFWNIRFGFGGQSFQQKIRHSANYDICGKNLTNLTL